MRARRETSALPPLTRHSRAIPLSLARRDGGADYGAGGFHVMSTSTIRPSCCHGRSGSSTASACVAGRRHADRGRWSRIWTEACWRDGDQLMFDGARLSAAAVADSLPAAASAEVRGLIGEYGWDHNVLYILERDGQLHALIEWFFDYPLQESRTTCTRFPSSGLYCGRTHRVRRAMRAGAATAARAARHRLQAARDGW